MILADKIIRLRKKNGWSQEELAERMNVSRQAVAKWEGSQSIPSLEKLLLLGELFGVSTDYLLKDEMEIEEFTVSSAETNVRRVTLEEANEYLKWRKTAAVQIAAAVGLCILAVIPLLFLACAAEFQPFGFTENAAGFVGMSALLVIAAVAVAIFIHCGFRSASWEFLNQDFETEYGVTGMVREQQNAYRRTYVRCNLTGVCICVLSPIPLFVGAFANDGFLTIIMLIVTMLLSGGGAAFFIVAGVRWASMQKLLKEGEFTLREKKKSRVKEAVGTVYWLIAAAIYAGWSLITDSWHLSWVVWPIAGILFAGVMRICDLILERNIP